MTSGAKKGWTVVGVLIVGAIVAATSLMVACKGRPAQKQTEVAKKPAAQVPEQAQKQTEAQRLEEQKKAAETQARLQMEKKIERVRADMRSVVVALEAYFVDWNAYPAQKEFPPRPIAPGSRPWFVPLTTPVAYIAPMPKDPFAAAAPTSGPAAIGGDYFHYVLLYNTYGREGVDRAASSWGPWVGFVPEFRARGYWHLLWSPGPDGVAQVNRSDIGANAFYDPTNGLVSVGDIVRLGPSASDRIMLGK
jgi:hypothetical protein